ncbi:MAG TPA: PH domain-containing protein [Ilumatobacter sp.]
MPYPKKLLNDTETVALDLHPHWWFFAKSGASMLVSILVGVASMIWLDGDLQKVVNWIAIAGIVISAVLLVSRYIQWFTTNFVITSDRIIFRTGVFAKHGIEIPLERVNNVIFHQSVIERILGAGDLLIESGGETGQQRFTEVRDPDRVQALIHTQVDAKMTRRGSQASGGDATGDVASQLERLEGMLQRGTLTPSEFEAQKRKLLGA